MHYEGDFAPPGRYAVLSAKFNSLIVNALCDGALAGLRERGVRADDIDVVRVPGAFELALAAKELGLRGGVRAVVCLGCVIRGDTDHYDYVAAAAAKGIADAALQTGVPTIFGVLTCDTLEQALQRAGGKAGNKGYEAALAAVEMASLLAKLRDGGGRAD